jgi:glutamate racemase
MQIGIFDSGYGGLSIFRSIGAALPEYDYLYLGDNARTPYGSRSFEAILKFSKECIDILFARGCKLVIVACNTASAKALRTIQQRALPHEHPDRRVLGVIRPSAEALAAYPRDRTVALWATEGTVKSRSFPMELEKLAPGLRLVQKACPLLVPMVEAGELSGPGIEYYIDKYWRETEALASMNQAGSINALLLACTHYPLLHPVIRARVPASVDVLVQGDIVAPSLVDYLSRHPEIEGALSRGGTRQVLTTDQTEGFDRLAEIFLGHPVVSERVDL